MITDKLSKDSFSEDETFKISSARRRSSISAYRLFDSLKNQIPLTTDCIFPLVAYKIEIELIFLKLKLSQAKLLISFRAEGISCLVVGAMNK